MGAEAPSGRLIVRVQIQADVTPLLQALERFEQEAAGARSRSLNRAIGEAQTSAVRELSRNLGLEAGYIQSRTQVLPATPQSQEATLIISDKRAPLIQFGASQSSAGVAYRFGGAGSTIRSAFVATMPSGHRGVYLRQFRGPGSSQRSRRGPRGSQLPIHERFGPSLATAFLRPEVYEPVVNRAGDALEQALTQELAALGFARA